MSNAEFIDEQIDFDGPVSVGEDMSFELLETQDVVFEIMKNPDSSQWTKGSDKMQKSRKLKYQLKAYAMNGKTGIVFHEIILNKKCMGFITNFLIGFGEAKENETINPDWNNMVELRAAGKVIKDNFKKDNGEVIEFNSVKTFYNPESERAQKLLSMVSPDGTILAPTQTPHTQDQGIFEDDPF